MEERSEQNESRERVEQPRQAVGSGGSSTLSRLADRLEVSALAETKESRSTARRIRRP
ncbi:hypothetical protein [Streptomyces sp. NPDC056817]|uniref:hypothetical protein n=1 Tax=Streptomyces sp. NPDC056817 TaxID=3345950 RepID=UPI0036B2A408